MPVVEAQSQSLCRGIQQQRSLSSQSREKALRRPKILLRSYGAHELKSGPKFFVVLKYQVCHISNFEI